MRPAIHRLIRRLNDVRTRQVLIVVSVALTGAWLGLVLGGHVTQQIGPVVTEMSVRLSVHGDTRVDIAPLGTLELDSHDGPLGLDVRVRQLDEQATRQIFDNPATTLEKLGDGVTSELRRGVVKLAAKAMLVAALGAGLATLLVLRRWRSALVSGGAVLVLFAGSAGLAASSWNPRSVVEPRYTGLLRSAPQVVGDARSIVANFTQYRQELAKLVTNVSELYDATAALPGFALSSDTIRVLHVSDIHLNPAAWDVIRSIREQFSVSVIVDTGDLTDHGSSGEDPFTDAIPSLTVPYVFIRGNHDSTETQAAVMRQQNAVVLDNFDVREVAGLRFAGVGDPRFTPDRSTRDAPNATDLDELARRFGERLATLKPPADVALVHDPLMARKLDGTAPLVLAGHAHKRSTTLLRAGTRLFVQGSTGGAGLRGLETERPTPIQCSVLYFDPGTRKLQAWDDVTLGGLGLSSVEIQRTLASSPDQSPGTPDQSPAPTPPSPTPAR